MISHPSAPTLTPRMLLPLRHELDALAVVGAKLPIWRRSLHQRHGTQTRRLVLAHESREFGSHRGRFIVQTVAIAVVAAAALTARGAVVARVEDGAEGILTTVATAVGAAVVYLDFALVADEAGETVTMVAGFVGEEIERVVFGVEGGFAEDAGRAVAAFERGDLGARRVWLVGAGKLGCGGGHGDGGGGKDEEGGGAG
mmetsp:Transcript_2842/g.5930  ORF Transcript_2842/g.5930 Transcript_2842/m.5930 type:complete len:199 (+) Transcript_2842:536-1132(+)